MNAENAIGGYNGFERFVWAGSVSIIEREMASGEMNKSWAQFCSYGDTRRDRPHYPTRVRFLQRCAKEAKSQTTKLSWLLVKGEFEVAADAHSFLHIRMHPSDRF
ncbi:MAG: hypothetical protein ABIT38_12945 [Gemmatimonadaceae bacterium]